MNITLRNVYHTYLSGTRIENISLFDVSFHVPKGEIVAIIGHTGSGKSTLLQHLNGLLKPSKGNVLIDGVDTSSKKLFTPVKKKIGLVMQYPEHQLFEETVYKDIAFILKKQNMSHTEIDNKIYEVINLVHLNKTILSSSPFELSGGQKRKVALAGVLINQPQLLILDEPTAGLDSESRNIILDVIKNLNLTYQTTVVLSLHSIEEVVKIADRVIILEHGKLIMNIHLSKIFDYQDKLESMGMAYPLITQFMKCVKDTLLPSINHKIFLVEQAKQQLIKFMNHSRG